jgi:galactonate dehydratase
MKITKVEPIMVDRFCFVCIETGEGLTGIGESDAWGQLEATAAAITKYAECLVGKDPRPIEYH